MKYRLGMLMNESYKPDPLIGIRFISRSNRKNKRVQTVVDKHVTYSAITGEVVKTRYVATHELMGRTVTDYDVCATTINLAEIV